MSNNISIIKRAYDSVQKHGGWESVYRHYPLLMDAVNAPGLSQVPCPFSGLGKTKFRLYKDWPSTGAGYHNDHQFINNGISMMLLLEPDYCRGNAGRAAKRILELLDGSASANPSRVTVSATVPKLTQEEIDKRQAFVDMLISKASPAPDHWLYKNYCRSRGLPAIPADDLLIGRNVFHREEDGTRSRQNAMLAVMRKPNGDVLTVHRIYLDPKGNGYKGINRKMMLPPPCQKGEVLGAAIRLAMPRKGPKGTVLALTEGIETGLAVMTGVGLPVWSCYSTALLETVQVPDDVDVVLIFADLDFKNGAGLESAEKCAKRLREAGKRVHICLPAIPESFNTEGKKGLDWLDIYNHCGPQEFKRQVKHCLSVDL